MGISRIGFDENLATRVITDKSSISLLRKLMMVSGMNDYHNIVERRIWRIKADTPQFRGGNSYFFSENLYQSVSFIFASMYHEKVHIARQFAKKSRHCVIKIDSQQQRTNIGALRHVARQSD